MSRKAEGIEKSSKDRQAQHMNEERSRMLQNQMQEAALGRPVKRNNEKSAGQKKLSMSIMRHVSSSLVIGYTEAEKRNNVPTHHPLRLQLTAPLPPPPPPSPSPPPSPHVHSARKPTAFLMTYGLERASGMQLAPVRETTESANQTFAPNIGLKTRQSAVRGWRSRNHPG